MACHSTDKIKNKSKSCSLKNEDDNSIIFWVPPSVTMATTVKPHLKCSPAFICVFTSKQQFT